MARPRIYDEDRVDSTLRLPRSLRERLRNFAGGRPANPIIEDALIEYLDRHEHHAVSAPTSGPLDYDASTRSPAGNP